MDNLLILFYFQENVVHTFYLYSQNDFWRDVLGFCGNSSWKINVILDLFSMIMNLSLFNTYHMSEGSFKCYMCKNKRKTIYGKYWK